MGIIKRKTFYNRIFMCFFSAFVVLAAAFLGYVVRQQRKQIIQNLEDRSRDIILSVNSNFSMLNRDVSSVIYRIFESPALTRSVYSKNIDEIQQILDYESIRTGLKTVPEFHSAVIYNNKTGIFDYFDCSEEYVGKIKNNITHNAKTLVSMHPYVDVIDYYGQKTENVFTYYAFDFIDENVLDGALAVNISMEWLDNILSDYAYNDINIVLCDEEGTIYYDRAKKYKYGQSLGFKYDFENETKSVIARNGGEKYLLSVSEMPQTGYYVLCEQKYNLMSEVYVSALLQSLLVFLFLTALGFVLSLRISGIIYRPIKSIKNQLGTYVTDENVFEIIAEIAENSKENTALISEMKNHINDIRRQERLKLLMYGQTVPEEDDVAKQISDCFGENAIIGAEFVFADNITMDKVRSVCMPEENNCSIVMMEYNIFILLIGADRLAVRDARPYVEKLAKHLNDELGKRPSVFITSCDNYGELPMLYEKLSVLRRYELMYGSGCVIDEDVLLREDGSETPYPKNEENKIIMSIINNKIDNPDQIFDDFLQKIIVMDVDKFRMSLMRLSLDILAVYEKDRGENLYQKVEDIVKHINNVRNMDEICRCLMELLDVCLSENSGAGQRPANPTVRAAIDYIENNYQRPELNLEMIAEKLNLSKNYVGKRFREETGKSVSKYLKEYRLKKAIEYLNTPNINIIDIVYKVGFVSESNFYKQFKQYYLMTPNDYRNIVSGEGEK